jgi:hypothetical protein
MKKRFTLNEEQQEELLHYPHIRAVSARMVQYTADFKRYALVERGKGIPPRIIFKQAGIPCYFNPDYAADRVNEWRRIAEKHGIEHFDNDVRGKVGATVLLRHMDEKRAYESMTDAQKVTYLETRTEALEHIARRFGLPPSIHKAHSLRWRKK